MSRSPDRSYTCPTLLPFAIVRQMYIKGICNTSIHAHVRLATISRADGSQHTRTSTIQLDQRSQGRLDVPSQTNRRSDKRTVEQRRRSVGRADGQSNERSGGRFKANKEVEHTAGSAATRTSGRTITDEPSVERTDGRTEATVGRPCGRSVERTSGLTAQSISKQTRTSTIRLDQRPHRRLDVRLQTNRRSHDRTVEERRRYATVGRTCGRSVERTFEQNMSFFWYFLNWYGRWSCMYCVSNAIASLPRPSVPLVTCTSGGADTSAIERFSPDGNKSQDKKRKEKKRKDNTIREKPSQ